VRVRASVLLVGIRQLRVVARPNVGGFLDSLVLLTSVLLISLFIDSALGIF
jgi:hypothetical protein